jgi:uncharacterized protein
MDNLRSRTELQFTVIGQSSKVSAMLLRPENARWLLVLAHGAGAGMRHAFLEAIAEQLASHQIATLRYQFPYMEHGLGRPDFPPILVATVRSAVATATDIAGDLPLIAGGKSLGGRMTSTAAAQAPLSRVHGLVFLGFPLHPAGKPSTERARHLGSVALPMLFLQGTRDQLAQPQLLRPVCEGLGDWAELHPIEGADHSFHVLKRSGRTDREVLEQLAKVVAGWTTHLQQNGSLDPTPYMSGSRYH